MIDHLLLYASEAERSAAWPSPTGMDGEPIMTPSWVDGERTIMPVRIVLDRAVFDGEGAIVSPEVTAPGVWMAIRTVDRDDDLAAMDACVIATDSRLMGLGQPYVIKCTLQPDTILGQVDPVWAGSTYDIPVGEPASALDDWRVA